jgi:hypothetical protein
VPVSSRASSGQQQPPTDPSRQPYRPGGRGAGPSAAGTRDRSMGSTAKGAIPVSRKRKPAARNRALGYPTPASSDWQHRHRVRRPGLPTTTNAPQPGAINPAHLTNTATYQTHRHEVPPRPQRQKKSQPPDFHPSSGASLSAIETRTLAHLRIRASGPIPLTLLDCPVGAHRSSVAEPHPLRLVA